MPLNVGKFGASWFLVLIFIFGAFAQAPTSADILRDRVKKARALIAVKSYTAAIYELEGIRRETKDPAVHGVVQVMLMNCYLEQSDYKRAQALLTELFGAQKANRPNANYYSVAAQVVKGARTQLDRYKNLGLAVSDRNLPVEALNDVNKMREMVETVITQSKTLGEDQKQIPLALPLLEEAINARSGLARDDFDAKRWREEIADTRENMMNSRSVVVAVDESALQNNTNSLAANINPNSAPAGESTASIVPVNSTNANIENKPAETPKPNTAANETAKNAPANTPEKPRETAPETNRETAQTQNTSQPNPTPNAPQGPTRSRLVPNANTQATETAPTTETSAKLDAPIIVGSLVDYATEKVNPTYPQAARTMRMTGVVRVELIVDENGDVSVESAAGPTMLQRAALDAVRKWKFRPFTRDGQPVKAKGYVSFNFNL
jgi:periplasmic protein TonB